MTSCLLWNNKNSSFIFLVLIQTIRCEGKWKFPGWTFTSSLTGTVSTSLSLPAHIPARISFHLLLVLRTCAAIRLRQYEVGSRPGVLVLLPEAAFLGFLIFWAHVRGSSFFQWLPVLQPVNYPLQVRTKCSQRHADGIWRPTAFLQNQGHAKSCFCRFYGLISYIVT